MNSKGIFDFLSFVDMFLNSNSVWDVKIAGAITADDSMNYNETNYLFNNSLDALNKKYPNRITYLGILKGTSRVNLLHTSKIMILPTFYRTEAIPLSIIESMRSGNIIISTEHNLIPNLISSLNGFLVPINDPNSIYEKVNELTSSAEKMQAIMQNNISTAKIKYNAASHIFEVKKILNKENFKK